MKKLILLFILIPSLLFAGGIQQKHKSVIAMKNVASGSAFEGDVLNETFDSTGYDDADWTETGVLDEDATTAPPIGTVTGFATQCLEYSASFSARYSVFDDSTDRPIIYLRTYIYIDEESLADAGEVLLVILQNSAAATEYSVSLYQTSGQLYFRFDDVPNTAEDDTAISIDTGYELEIKYDDTNNLTEFRVNGVSEYSATSDPGQDFSHVAFGLASASIDTTTIFFDGVDIDTTSYPTD